MNIGVPVRLLLDQNVPRGLSGLLRDHEVVAAAQQGWAELENGELLAAAEAAGFDLLVTCDRNLRYQQNLSGRRIGVLVLTTNNWEVLRSDVAVILGAVNAAQVGSFAEITFAPPRLRRRDPPRRGE